VLPTLFHVGPVAVHSYGTLLMVGFVAGILLAGREAKRLGLGSELAVDLGLWALVAGVVGARATFVALNWKDFSARPVEALYVWQVGGLSFHGGLLGGVVAAGLLARRRRVSFWSLADMAAAGLALGYGITRFGCFLNGCCYGRPTSLPWGVRFPLFPDSAITTEPSHPTQIYAALGSFLILAVLLWMRPRLSVRGQLFLLYLLLYSVLRAAIEVLRKGYTAQVLVDGVTQAQAASAVIFVGALAGLMWLGRKSRKLAARG
jgi:phosphatidylglycerol:prolipoprotein diacylglycerol transferase